MLSKILSIFKKNKDNNNNNNNNERDSNIKKENIAYGPTIDYSKCKNCGICYKLCKNNVYDLINNKVVVINKENCSKQCNKCNCSAISFPNL